jgi:hypothetical protein
MTTRPASRRELLKRAGYQAMAASFGGACPATPLKRDRGGSEHTGRDGGALIERRTAPVRIEAHAMTYIDRALGGALAASREASQWARRRRRLRSRIGAHGSPTSRDERDAV